MSLSERFRPQKLSQVAGQGNIIKSICNRVASDPPQTWMFVGPPGTGKTTISRILAISYQCDHQPAFGEPCDACWADRENLYTEVNASETAGVEELGKIVQLSRLRPMNATYRIIILDEAQRISPAAQNLLLKPLEEPAPTTLWFICTTDPTKLSAAIKRRPATYNIKPLGFAETEKYLKSVATAVGFKGNLSGLLDQLHLAGVHAPGVMLPALEKFISGEAATDSVWGSVSEINSYELCKAVTRGSWKDVQTLLNDKSRPVSNEDCRFIRTSVAGWLKGVLVKSTNMREQEIAAVSILELCALPFDESISIYWLHATLAKICQRFNVRNNFQK